MTVLRATSGWTKFCALVGIGLFVFFGYLAHVGLEYSSAPTCPANAPVSSTCKQWFMTTVSSTSIQYVQDGKGQDQYTVVNFSDTSLPAGVFYPLTPPAAGTSVSVQTWKGNVILIDLPNGEYWVNGAPLWQADGIIMGLDVLGMVILLWSARRQVRRYRENPTPPTVPFNG